MCTECCLYCKLQLTEHTSPIRLSSLWTSHEYSSSQVLSYCDARASHPLRPAPPLRRSPLRPTSSLSTLLHTAHVSHVRASFMCVPHVRASCMCFPHVVPRVNPSRARPFSFSLLIPSGRPTARVHSSATPSAINRPVRNPGPFLALPASRGRQQLHSIQSKSAFRVQFS